MQARYYDPVIGRFYSNDPVDAVAHLSNEEGIRGFNRYSYAVNNPYKYTDPDGRCITGIFTVPCIGAAIIILGGGAVAIDNISDGTETIGETQDALKKRTDAVNARFDGIKDYIDSGGTTTTISDLNELSQDLAEATHEAGEKIRNDLPDGIKKVAGSIPGTTISGTVPSTLTDAVITGATNIATSDILEKDKHDQKQ
jgi:hypothetical protein